MVGTNSQETQAGTGGGTLKFAQWSRRWGQGLEIEFMPGGQGFSSITVMHIFPKWGGHSFQNGGPIYTFTSGGYGLTVLCHIPWRGQRTHWYLEAQMTACACH